MEEKVNKLPKGWVRTKVGEIYDIIGGGTPSTKVDKYWEGDIPWITSADIIDLKEIRPRNNISKEAIQNSATNLVPENSLVVVTRVGLGKISLTKTPLCFSQDSQALVGNTSLIFPDYSLYHLSQAVQIFKYRHRGTTIAGVTKKQLSELPFALPPLPEQHRIVGKIEELFTRLDAGVEAFKKIRVQLKRYRQAVLKYAFEGKLTEKWREAHKGELESASANLERIEKQGKKEAKGKLKELPPIDTSELVELPGGWVWTPLPRLGELNRGKSKHRPRDDARLFGGNYPFIQTGEVRNSKGLIKSYSQTYNDFGLKQSKLWPMNTLCITIAANIAETAILDIPACFPDSIVGFIADDKLCEVKYIHFFLKTIKNKLESFAPATAQKNINLDTLKNVVVPLSPFPEQQKIVEEIESRLSIADNIERVAEQSLKQSERLRQSILKRAFEGKLVPQDPTDEPAEKLLGRIKEEKAKREMGNKEERKHRNKNSKQMELI